MCEHAQARNFASAAAVSAVREESCPLILATDDFSEVVRDIGGRRRNQFPSMLTADPGPEMSRRKEDVLLLLRKV